MAKTKNTAALDMVNDLAEHQPGNHKDKMNPTMAALQSEDHKILLDAIDKLRSKGVSQYVDLPQIVVCGDQSSGKSSVLQAVSNMSFPIKDNLVSTPEIQAMSSPSLFSIYRHLDPRQKPLQKVLTSNFVVHQIRH